MEAEKPDLPSQYESLLDEVWRCEADWRLDDRIDMAMKIRRAGRGDDSSRSRGARGQRRPLRSIE